MMSSLNAVFLHYYIDNGNIHKVHISFSIQSLLFKGECLVSMYSFYENPIQNFYETHHKDCCKG